MNAIDTLRNNVAWDMNRKRRENGEAALADVVALLEAAKRVLWFEDGDKGVADFDVLAAAVRQVEGT